MKEISTQPNGEAKPRVRPMSSMEQAAILMLSMGDDISAGVLKHFSREEIIGIAQVLGITETELLADVTGRAAGKGRQHSVSSAPSGESDSRERLDGPPARREGES